LKHTAEPLLPEPSALEVELAIEKLKSHKSPGIDQMPAELIKAGGRTIRCAIHKLIIAIWNKEELPEEWKVLIIVPILKHPQPAFRALRRRPGFTPIQNHGQNYSSIYPDLLSFWIATLKTTHSAPNDSKHSLISICS
jgi:hypothetical protein